MDIDNVSNSQSIPDPPLLPTAVVTQQTNTARSLKRWDIAANTTYITQSIKMRLHCKTDALKNWIRNSVDKVSRIAIHVSRFSNMYILHCCQQSLPLPPIDQVFFNNVMYLITNTQSNEFKDVQLQNAYVNLYKPLLRDFKIDRDTDCYRFLEVLSSEMQANAKVYMKTQFITRFRKWCKDTVNDFIPLDENDPQLKEKKQQRWKIVSYLFQETAKSNSLEIDVGKICDEAQTNLSEDCALIWNENVMTQLALAIQSARRDLDGSITTKAEKFIHCRPITNGKLVRTDLNHCYLRWTYKRLLELEQHNSDPQKTQKKVFSMLPIRSLDRCYITISNTALLEWVYRNRSNKSAVGEEIYNKTKHFYLRDDFTKQFYTEPLWYWQQCFDFTLHGRSQFFGPIATDGYTCTIVTKKTILQTDVTKDRDTALITLQDDERTRDTKMQVLDEQELMESDVVGVDPGRRTLYTSAFECNDKDKHSITSYSAGRWRHESGGNKAKLKREQMAKRAGDEYNKWLLEMPSCKVATVEAMQKHVQHLMLRFDQCFAINGRTAVKKLRFSNYIYKQKALSRMVEEFISQTKKCNSTKEKLVVAFGDASFKTSGPVKKMKKELQRRENVKLVNMDEFHTSAMMTCCAFASESPQAIERTSPLVKRIDMQTGVESESRPYGISYCKKCTCYWNRDVNAAVNMLRVFQHAQQHAGERHEFFSRSVPTSKKQKRTAAKQNEQRDAKKQKNAGVNLLASLSDLVPGGHKAEVIPNLRVANIF